MKKLDELGISPMPWIALGGSITSGSEILMNPERFRACDMANAHLIAAAPKLYECLCQAVSFIEDNAELL